MWELEQSADFQKRAKKLAKTNRQELKNVTDNLAAYLADLRKGLAVQQIVRGYIHSEPNGIKALDESGPGAHKKATRLYIYPDEETETLFVLIVGDKKSQGDDIKSCSDFVKKLLKDRGPQDENLEY